MTTTGAQSGGGRDAPARLWDAVLDARAYHECAKHRLVWCDTSAGSPPCPEGRPLRPYALLNVTAQPDGKAALQRVRAAADLCGAGWARLGSPWTAAQVATPYRDVAASREGVASRYPSSSDPLAADGARGGGGPGANGAHAPAAAGGTEVVWNLVVSPDGEEYYHNVLTDETAWDPPPGARVVDGRRTR
ncbi:unnamed protein product [Prorocentrum cordatum]|uniref:WW domain-containing protein n=1 Tax=Prorocentrum cordatum TaxID=2364126 RepID=A0ABN9URK9_9DINO|nr:unnamed protein product [Polarella glacialis]